MSGLEPGAYHWRLRLLYDPVTTPFASASRWFSVPRNGWEERDLTISPFVGGKVWEDDDVDGIMDGGEPFLGAVPIQLLDDVGAVLQTTATAVDGSYRFDVGTEGGVTVRFTAPGGWAFTLRDQGADDSADSDADPATGETDLISAPYESSDEVRWSAGVRFCLPLDEPIYIYGVRLSTDGNDYPILDFQDLNAGQVVTGYNVYRSSDASLPAASWPRVATDVVDMDGTEPDIQWEDTSGDASPTGIWYYEVTAYDSACDEEGPR